MIKMALETGFEKAFNIGLTLSLCGLSMCLGSGCVSKPASSGGQSQLPSSVPPPSPSTSASSAPLAQARLQAESDAQAQKRIAVLCTPSSQNGKSGPTAFSSDLIKTLTDEVIVQGPLRAALAAHLTQPDGATGPCGLAVKEILSRYLAKPALGAEKGSPKAPFVILGLHAGLPEATRILEIEVLHGDADDWLDTLGRIDKQASLRAMKMWVAQAAQAIRQLENISSQSYEAYGEGLIEGQGFGRESVRLVSPLLVEKFLREVRDAHVPLSPAEISDLNVVFAGTNPTYRQIFVHSFAAIVQSHIGAWIPAFRKEPVWVQFRLFPLMANLRGPEVVRELMWLSSHHADSRVRSLAGRTLDEVVSPAQR